MQARALDPDAWGAPGIAAAPAPPSPGWLEQSIGDAPTAEALRS